MSLTSGETEAWICTGQKKKPHAEWQLCFFNSEDQQTPVISGFKSSFSPIPQSRPHGRVLHMTQSTSTQGSFSPLSWGFWIWIVLSLQWWLRPMQRPDKISSKRFCRIYHRARSPFTCSLHSSRSFQHLRISKGVTQQCCVVWNPVGKQCCIQQETYLCMHWCNA